MRRTILPLAGVLLSVVALGSDSPKEYDDRTEVAGIEGTWRLTEWESFGFKAKANRLPYKAIVTFRTGTYTVFHDDSDTHHGNYRIDATHKPPHLDSDLFLERVKNHTGKCIYQIDGDRLRIALLPEAQRPKEFIDDQDRIWIFTYRRVK